MGKEIIIKGGGPAGLSCALYFLNRGYKCKIIEKPDYPERMKNRGFQVLENYTKKEDSLNLLKELQVEDFFCYPLNKAVFWDFKYNFYNFFSKENFGYLIKRGAQEGSIDRAMLNRAKELGLDFVKKEETFQICATGSSQPDGIAQERHFETDDKLRIWILMNPERINGGYAYIFTYGGKGTFGCAITYKFKEIKEISQKCWDFFQEIENIRVENLKVYHSYVNFYIPESYEEDGILYAGEVAGMQDFFLGLGIRIAMEAGILAARCIIEGFSYTKEIKNKFTDKFKSSFVLRVLYEKTPEF
ncbi:MAG: hypothetical protein WHV67_02895, partial [Thermoanaerobaculia bacterium]